VFFANNVKGEARFARKECMWGGAGKLSRMKRAVTELEQNLKDPPSSCISANILVQKFLHFSAICLLDKCPENIDL